MIAPSMNAPAAIQRESGEVTYLPDHLSASSISLFGQCSLKWLFSRLYDTAWVPSALAFGAAIHSCFEHHSRQLMTGESTDATELLAVFTEKWNAFESKKPVRYGSREDRDALMCKAANIIDVFLDTRNGERTILAIEEPLSIQLADDLPPIIGFIDLITLERSGDDVWIGVYDYKTAAKKPGESVGKDKMDQLVLYNLALKSVHAVEGLEGLPVKLSYEFFTKTKKAARYAVSVEPTRRDKERFIAKARAVWRAIQANAIHPQRGWMCSSCPYTQHCSKWPDWTSIERNHKRKNGGQNGRLQTQDLFADLQEAAGGSAEA